MTKKCCLGGVSFISIRLVVLGILAIFSISVSGTTYMSEYGSNSLQSIQVQLGSSHNFEIDGCPNGYKVEWYFTYSGGSPVETDDVRLFFDPDINRTFSVAGQNWVRAEIYDADWRRLEIHRWDVSVIGTTPRPDLIVENIWTEPASVVAGQPYIIYARVRNVGDAVANVILGNQEVRFFVDGTPVDTESYDNLDPGEPVVVQTSPLTAPSAGTFSVRVEADYNDDVDESSESNNDRTKSFSSGPVPLPDLVILGINAPSSVIAGEMFSFSVTVKNIGNAEAVSSYTGIYIDGSLEGTIPTSALASGSQQTVMMSVAAPSFANTYQLKAKADVYEVVTESNEDNNWSPNNWLTVLPPPVPDLVIQSLTVDSDYAWRSSTITAIIFNNGSASAEFGNSSQVGRIDVDGQPITGGGIILPVTVIIPPGGTYPVSGSFTPNEQGNSTITAVADPYNIVFESSEVNNTRTESKAWIASTIHDTDDDGMIDADEVVAGSEPNNSSNVWKCDAVSTNSGFMVTWPSIANRFYTVERSYNLTNDFVVIASNLPASPPENSYLDTATSNAFYRIEVRE